MEGTLGLKVWNDTPKGRTTLIYLLSGVFGGLLEGVLYLSFRLSETLSTDTSTLSYYSTTASVVTLASFFVVLDASLFPNVPTAISIIFNGLMFFVLPIALLSESSAEQTLNATNITVLTFFYFAYGISNGGLYVLAPVFLRKLWGDEVNVSSQMLAYSGGFQALGIGAVMLTDLIFGLFMPNIGLVTLIYFACGALSFVYAYYLFKSNRESTNEVKKSYKLRKSPAPRADSGGRSSGNSTQGSRSIPALISGAGLFDYFGADDQRAYPVGFSSDRIHFDVEYTLFFVEIFRAGSFATTMTFMFLFCDESEYEFVDADHYQTPYSVALVCFLVGKLIGPLGQEWWGGVRAVYRSLLVTSIVPVILFSLFLIFTGLQNAGYFGFALGLYSLLQGPTYSLLLDYNNRLTFESNRSSTILIVANILGFLYPNIVSVVYGLTGRRTEIFIYNIILCGLVTGLLVDLAPGLSYLDLEKDGFSPAGSPPATSEERQPIVQSTVDGGETPGEVEEEEEEEEEGYRVADADTDGIV